MDRQQALEEMHRRVHNSNLCKHMYLSSSDGSPGKKAGRHEDSWALAGLLHDIVMRKLPPTGKAQPGGAEILEGLGVDADIVYAVSLQSASLERLTAWTASAH